MKIAINTRFLLPGGLEGIGRFTYEICKRLVENHPEDTFYFLFDRPYSDEFLFGKNVVPIVVGPPARHPVLWKIWFDYKLPGVLRKIKPDVFFSPDGYTSLRAKVKKVTVFHDLAFEHYPRTIPRGVARFYQKNTPKYVASSNRCITVSEYGKKDIQEQYGIEEQKIEVVYNACESHIPTDRNLLEEVDAFLDGAKYFLYLGAIHPRKNVLAVLKAYRLFRQNNFREVKFILAGRDAWGNQDLKNYLDKMSFKEDVLFLGSVGDEKYSLLENAAGLIYCSLFEGFGIPIIEAQQMNCPVITSDVSSMPEVGGDAVLLANPKKSASIAEQMGRLINEPGLADKLRVKGKENIKRFSWDESAEKVYKIIKNVAEH